jgi:2-dehydropantoate 2-reductase
MRIAIFGSGAVGGYFGGRLAAAGADVTFIARGAQLAALRERGLRLVSPNGDLHLPRVQATDDAKAVGPVDVVLFTVKLYDTASAVPMLSELIGPHTLVVPLQNGVDTIDMVAGALGRPHVAGGTTYIVAAVVEPGVIRHMALGRLIFGPIEDPQRPPLEELLKRCIAAGIDATLSDRIVVDIWGKFVRLTAFSGMTSVTRSPIGVVQADPDLRAMLRAAVHESLAVARAKGVPLPESIADDIAKGMSQMPFQAKSSMLEDLEHGRRLELPWLSGAVVRIGQEVGVDTPTHKLIAAILRPHVNGTTS